MLHTNYTRVPFLELFSDESFSDIPRYNSYITNMILFSAI